MGARGKLWGVISRMYDVSRSALCIEGEKSASFSVEQGITQGSSLSPIFINDLLKEIEKANLGMQLSSGKKVLLADDFVGVCNSAENLQSLIDTVHGYCSRWRLRANVSKSVVMVFSKASVSGEWKWGEYICYLGFQTPKSGI